MATYTVQPGDSLPSIARALLGDPGRWRELQLHNRLLLVDPAKLAPGMQLRLPPGAAIPAKVSGSAPAGRPRQKRLGAVARAGRGPSSWPRR